MSSPSRRPLVRIQGDNVLGAALTIAQLTKDVTDLAKVPIASQVASLVLSLLEIAKDVKDNNDARVRLATTAATYLIELEPILVPQESEDNASEAFMERMERFNNTLLDLKDELEAMKNKGIIKRLWGKEHISTKLLDREKALHASYSALLMWTVADTNIAVRNFIQSSIREESADDIGESEQYSLREVRLKGRISGAYGFFANVELGMARGQRVIVKRVGDTTERDREARKWTRLWHSNLPHLVGYSKNTTKMHFLLFSDDWFDTSGHMAQVGSVVAIALEMTRSYDAFSIVNTLVDYTNDAISAFRHIQKELDLTEDETTFLTRVTRYTLSSDGRIIVAPPLQEFAKDGGGVSNRVYWSFFPSYGTSKASIGWYFAGLDRAKTWASVANDLNAEQLDKWSLVTDIMAQIQVLPDRVEKLQELVMPETRRVYADYSLDVKPGDFGVLGPGKWEYAFQRVASSSSALFSYKTDHYLSDSKAAFFDFVQTEPMTWKLELDRLTEGSIFVHQSVQRLAYDVHRAKRFLELSAPKDCGVDKLVFIVACLRYYNYKHTVEEPQVAEIYAKVADPDSGELRFSYCDPSECPTYCPLDSRISVDNYYKYMRIEYVTIPIERCSANLDVENKQDSIPFMHKEYESIIQRKPSVHVECNLPWSEWP